METALQFWVSGDDLSIPAGYRLRIRFYIDDLGGGGNGGLMTTGYTATFYFAATGSGSGDTYLTFPITLSQYSAATSLPLVRSIRHPLITR